MLEKFLPSFRNSAKRPINESAQPAMTIKPHHLLQREVWGALRGEMPGLLADGVTSCMVSNKMLANNDYGYYSDVIGEADISGERYKHALELVLNKLATLPNDVVIHLDLQPDEMCKSCIVGRHCTATNYRSEYPPRNVLEGERKILSQILAQLVEEKFKPGIDFVAKPTTHTFYDFEGRPLNSPQESTPVNVVFNSLLVRAGALRQIIVRNTRALDSVPKS